MQSNDIQGQPPLSRDPYRVIYLWGVASDAFRNNYRRGVWVPAQGRDDDTLTRCRGLP
jgi:hypothetical protein